MSDCGCIGGWDGPEAICYLERVVVARKPHTCVECRRVIAPGHRYERITGLWDGKWDTFRMCLACSEISHLLSCGGRVFGILWDEVESAMFDDIGSACFDKLETAHAKAFLRAKWQEWKGLDPDWPTQEASR